MLMRANLSLCSDWKEQQNELWHKITNLFLLVGKRTMVMEVPGKEGEEDRNGGGWITSRTICRRDNCQRRKHKTMFNGGVS